MAETNMRSISVDNQGRVLIPKAVRQVMGVTVGEELVAWLDDGRLVLESRAALLGRLKARYRDVEGSMAEELIRERREEAAREENE